MKSQTHMKLKYVSMTLSFTFTCTTLQNKGLYYAYECNDMEKVEELVSRFKDKKYAIVSFVFDIVIHFFK